MKRINNIWQDLIRFENLHKATYRVLRGKRGQFQAGQFFYDLEGEIFKLQTELIQNSYIPGEYRTFWIYEPKPRLISAAPFRDRVVHHALINCIEPVFERRFVHHSYACRKGKGNHRALGQFVKWGRGSKYVLKMDIRKFFPSIDHEILKSTLQRAIKDKEVLRLCNRIINKSNPQEPVTQWFFGDDLLAPVDRRHGIPIGNLTSQFFGNVYLDGLDHFVKERLGEKKYLRYVDDFAVFGDSKQRLQEIRAQIVIFLQKYRLKLNEGKSRIRRFKEGVEFLGFVCLPDRLRLSARNIRINRRRLKRHQDDYKVGLSSWQTIKTSHQAWEAHASLGDTWRLRQMISRLV